MISDLCDTLNANKDMVLNSIGSDSRIGNKYFKPGYSFGGPCFPRDTKALKQIMDQNSIFSDLLASTTESNEWHCEYQTKELLKHHQDTYVFENVCYKENSIIPMIEESAKLKIAKKLVKLGKNVLIKDVKDIIISEKVDYLLEKR
jgi:UDP-glucose 6-dehydrogenase